MFNGIIECKAILCRKTTEGDNLHLEFESPLSSSLRVDESVAHHGVCMTITSVEKKKHRHKVVAVAQTLENTNLCHLAVGEAVNMERALIWGERMNGHFVQGHVDGVLRCLEITEKNGSWVLHMELLPPYRPFLIEKGSVCLNGVSLTAYGVQKEGFKVSIIPHTFQKTTFSHLQREDKVNVEFDMLGKYILQKTTPE